MEDTKILIAIVEQRENIKGKKTILQLDFLDTFSKLLLKVYITG